MIELSHRAQAVLEMLREAGDEGCLPGDFTAKGCRQPGAVIDELIMAGFDIEQDELSGAAFTYRLVYEPEAADRQPSEPEVHSLPPTAGLPCQQQPVGDPGPEQLFTIEEPPSGGYLDPDLRGALAA